jgi:membrane associated rhomboid family serine protease
MPKNYKILSLFNVTLNLILINVTTFLAFTLLLFTKIFPVDLIALKPANILEGKYLWTFLTSMFMHAGIFHIFVNMLSLLFLGSFVERLIGSKRFFYFYLLSGIFSGIFFVLLSILIQGDFNSYAVGSSGAIFGLVGLLMILTPNLPVYVLFIPIPIKMKYAGPGVLIVLWLVSIAGNIPIGNTAHLGGLFAGLIYGIYLKKKYRRKTNYIKNIFS